MRSAQKMTKIEYHTPLFNNCFKIQPFASSSNSTWYIVLAKNNESIQKNQICQFTCNTFNNENFDFIAMQGESLEEYLRKKQANRQFPFMTQEQIQYFVLCMAEALIYLKNNGLSQKMCHLKQYCIRRVTLSNKTIYKLIFHQQMISQIDAARKADNWSQFYMSPQQLNGQFVSQKSIIFSLGLMLINICSHKFTNNYHSDKFQINWNILKQKFKNMRLYYSHPLCNLIQKCLVQNYRQRYDFYELKQAFNRKMNRKFQKYSQLLTQMSVYAKQQTLSYTLILPQHMNFQQSKKKSKQIFNTPQKNKVNNYNYNQSADEIQLQKHNNQTKIKDGKEKQAQLSDFNNKKKQKKRHGQKYEGSRVSKGQNQKIYENILKFQQQNIKNGKDVQRQFQYRGTFGQKTENKQSSHQQNLHKTQNLTQAQKNKINNKQSNKIEEELKNIDEQIKNIANKYETIGNIQTIKQHTSQNIVNYNKIQEIQTPKGFGRFNFHYKAPIQSSPLSYNQYIKKAIPDMKILTFQQCLRPIQQISKSIDKVGVWIQGDIYYGNFLAGRRDGLGLQIFADKNQYYYGHFKDDLFTGEGFYFWNDRQYFLGRFELGQKIWGTLQGEIKYQGYFVQNKRHGFGTCWYQTGQIYSGQWEKGKKHGQGVLIEPNQSKFFGSWAKGKRKGNGHLETDQMKISGYWNDQIIEGQTTIEYSNGDFFKGKTGATLQKLNGQYKSRSGWIFKGAFKDDGPQQGQLSYSNGDRYIGYLENMKRHGYGQYYYASGEIYKGKWTNNKKVT